MGKRGFTLLELLMVVIIIAILASIALPQYVRATEKMRASEALQILGAARGAEDRYRAQSPTNVFTSAAGDVDFDWGAMNYWTNDVYNQTETRFKRTVGAYINQTWGIILANGAICGNFAPMAVGLACP